MRRPDRSPSHGRMGAREEETDAGYSEGGDWRVRQSGERWPAFQAGFSIPPGMEKEIAREKR